MFIILRFSVLWRSVKSVFLLANDHFFGLQLDLVFYARLKFMHILKSSDRFRATFIPRFRWSRFSNTEIELQSDFCSVEHVIFSSMRMAKYLELRPFSWLLLLFSDFVYGTCGRSSCNNMHINSILKPILSLLSLRWILHRVRCSLLQFRWAVSSDRSVYAFSFVHFLLREAAPETFGIG